MLNHGHIPLASMKTSISPFLKIKTVTQEIKTITHLLPLSGQCLKYLSYVYQKCWMLICGRVIINLGLRRSTPLISAYIQ